MNKIISTMQKLPFKAIQGNFQQLQKELKQKIPALDSVKHIRNKNTGNS